jgi:hypothetical protein
MLHGEISTLKLIYIILSEMSSEVNTVEVMSPRHILNICRGECYG